MTQPDKIPPIKTKGMGMNLIDRESLTALLAVACAAAVFVGAALDLPDGAPTPPASAQGALVPARH